jgi:hypothetical protein
LTLQRLKGWAQAMLARAALFLALLGMPGCTAMTLKQVNPEPNVALLPQQHALKLALADAVPDAFTEGAGRTVVHVEAWRESLANGFQNAFASAFTPTAGNEDLTLSLDEVKLEFGAFGGSAPARVYYKATLYGPKGAVRRTSGMASRSAAGTWLPPRQLFSGALLEPDGQLALAPHVEATLAEMYEQIAKRLLGKESMSRR